MLKITGTGAAPGLCVGPVRRLARPTAPVFRAAQAPHREQALFDAARILAKDELGKVMESAPEKERDIFLFQQLMLDDGGFCRTVAGHIAQGAGAAVAVDRAADEYAGRLEAVADEYISQRGTDVRDVCRRLYAILSGVPRRAPALREPSVLVADEVLPSELASIDKAMLLGIVTRGGSLTGHTAILARGMGIPAVVMADAGISSAADGMVCAVDGAAGEAWLAPDEATRARFLHRMGLARRRSLRRERLRDIPCVTAQGVRVHLYANCSTPAEVADAIAAGAEGVGLLRSEFLYMEGALPDEEAQYAFFRDCLLAAGGRPVTIRTFDIGADKKVEGISPEEEENPALGLRGLRLALARPDVFLPHLRALLRAGAHGPLRIMFPMVNTPGEYAAAMDMVETARRRLEAEGLAFGSGIEWGIMVETPAAALLAEELAKSAAFFSIGTNDLTQYALAADRVNPAVAPYYDEGARPVELLMEMAAAGARAGGIPVSVCGEAAANPALARRFVAMGITSLSMAYGALLEVKEALLPPDALE